MSARRALPPVLVAAVMLGALAASADAAQVGRGTPASCTSAAVVRAVAAGGRVTFNCGPRPVTIRMRRTAKVRNTNPLLILDGGGKVTLSGMGRRRILYQNTCDRRQVWTTPHCQNQANPRLIVKGMRFVNGNATGQRVDGGGGGAIFVRGGRLTVVDSRFVRNRCDPRGPDVGGAAIRALSQYRNRPVRVVRSTFLGGRCANGGAISSIGVSWAITDSLFRGNRAIGIGANPARSGTPGGGNGGAIYLDGNRMTLTLRRSRVEGNVAREGGGGIFFVSNDRTGTATLAASTLRRNRSLRFETRGLPGDLLPRRATPPNRRRHRSRTLTSRPGTATDPERCAELFQRPVATPPNGAIITATPPHGDARPHRDNGTNGFPETCLSSATRPAATPRPTPARASRRPPTASSKSPGGSTSSHPARGMR